MNIDLLLALIFYGVIILYISKNKSRFQFQGKLVAIYRTKIGLKLMDKIANKDSNKFVQKTGLILTLAGIISLVYGIVYSASIFQTVSYLLLFFGLLIIIPFGITGVLSIITGFAGMGFIFYWLFKGTFDLLMLSGAAPAVAPVLPGLKVIPGLPILSFMHWILAILIIAVIHEFSHGIYTRLYKVKVKSSGLALFGPILAAFAEPEEKQLSKKSKRIQLSVFSAGPFSNILTGFLFILLMSQVTLPLYNAAYEGDGIVVHDLIEGYPMEDAGLETPFKIIELNNQKVNDFSDFLNSTSNVLPGDEVELKTDKGAVSFIAAANPENESKGFMGVSNFELARIPKEAVVEIYGALAPPTMQWIHMLFFWLWIVSWGVGLFNLLPLGPVDGGRMFLTGLESVTTKKRAHRIWKIVSLTCLLLIFINMAPFLWKLFLFLIKPLMFLIALV